MNYLETVMYNEGERLIPYVSHDEAELVRHRSSYAFFHAVLAHDRATAPADAPFTIVDLGFGVGYGAALLSSLPGAHITGVDISPDCATFAHQYYPRRNVDYVIADLSKYVPTMPVFDYVVSRGVLEHVPGGLDLVAQAKYARRLLIDVPYDEAVVNPHHVLHHIREDAFARFPDAELFYEDLDGAIFPAHQKPPKPNLIMLVLSAPDLPKISSWMTLPVPPVRDTVLEDASRATRSGRQYTYQTVSEIELAVHQSVRETEVVLDIGCGLKPISYFRPKLHLLVEPWWEYADILSYRHAGDKSVIILRSGALEALKLLDRNSVDSIFLLDVVEHFEKAYGLQVIAECERVAREQIVIFTPLGFMPQHAHEGETDGWGLSGTTVQEHLSGWTPADFSADWEFHVCPTYHAVNFRNAPLPENHGAFYAIRTFDPKPVTRPARLVDIRRLLPSEQVAAQLRDENRLLQARIQELESANAEAQRLAALTWRAIVYRVLANLYLAAKGALRRPS